MDPEFERYLNHLGRLYIQGVTLERHAYVLRALGGIFALAAHDVEWIREGARSLGGFGGLDREAATNRAWERWARHRHLIEQRVARGEDPMRALSGYLRGYHITELQGPADADELGRPSITEGYGGEYPTWRHEFIERQVANQRRLEQLDTLVDTWGGLWTTADVLSTASDPFHPTDEEWARSTARGRVAQNVAEVAGAFADVREARQAQREVIRHSAVDPRATTVVVSGPAGYRPPDPDAVRSVTPSARSTRPSDRRVPTPAPTTPGPRARGPGRGRAAADLPSSARARPSTNPIRVRSRPSNAERLGIPFPSPPPTSRRPASGTSAPDEPRTQSRRATGTSSASEASAEAQPIERARLVDLDFMMDRALMVGSGTHEPVVRARRDTLRELGRRLVNAPASLQTLYSRINDIRSMADLVDHVNHQVRSLISRRGGQAGASRNQLQGYLNNIAGRVAENIMHLDFRGNGRAYADELARRIRARLRGVECEVHYVPRAFTRPRQSRSLTGTAEITDGLYVAEVTEHPPGQTPRRFLVLLCGAESKASFETLLRSLRTRASGQLQPTLQLARMMQRFGTEDLVFDVQGTISSRDPTGASGTRRFAGLDVMVDKAFTVFVAAPALPEDMAAGRRRIAAELEGLRQLGIRTIQLRTRTTTADIQALSKMLLESAEAALTSQP
jgi:hypothetical protein